MKSLIARMRAGRVYVFRDLRPPPSGGQGLVTSRPLGHGIGIPLGIPSNLGHRFRRVNLQLVATLDSRSF